MSLSQLNKMKTLFINESDDLDEVNNINNGLSSIFKKYFEPLINEDDAMGYISQAQRLFTDASVLLDEIKSNEMFLEFIDESQSDIEDFVVTILETEDIESEINEDSLEELIEQKYDGDLDYLIIDIVLNHCHKEAINEITQYFE